MNSKGLISSEVSSSSTCRRLFTATVMLFSFVMVDMVAVGQQRTNQPSRSLDASKDSTATDDRVTQRWIPIDRRKLGELGRLGELLQNPKKPLANSSTTQQPDFNTGPSQRSLPIDLSKVDLRDLEERLAGLTPDQRDRLKKLANQLSKNDAAKELSSAYKDLPPALVDQVRESPSLREFAKEVLEEGQGEEEPKDSDSLLLDDSNNQPWIKFDPANSSLTTDATTQRKSANLDSVESSLGTEARSKNLDGTPSNQKPSAAPADRTAINRYEGEGIARSKDGEANLGNQEQRIQNGNRRSSDLAGNASRPLNNNSNRTRLSLQPTGQQPARQQSNGASNTGNQKPETAFEALKRRVGELGLGQTFEKLAKEAVGIEKSREDNVNDKRTTEKSTADSNRKEQDSRDPRKDAVATKRPSELERRDPAKGSESNDSQSRSTNDRQALAQNQSSQVRPASPKPESVSKPASSQSGETESSFSAWRAPTWNDLPSFSYWYLVGVLLIILVLCGLFLVNRSPEIAKRVAQRRQEAEQRARLLDMEIANREQVVLAFDTFVSKQLRSFEDWWTSQRVVKYVSDQKLGYSSQLLAAEKIYKNARYSPPDQKLSEEELTTVRDAIRQCAKSKETE